MSSALNLSEFLGRISAGRDGIPISIDEAQEVSGLNRASVLERFRKLQSEGEGFLRLGRHGHPTRFYFRSPSAAKPAASAGASAQRLDLAIRGPSLQAAGAPSERQPMADSAVVPMVEHHYQLRGDLKLSISLPADLTEREAGRIARFIETLPL